MAFVEVVEIPAQEVRLPERAVEALARRTPVVITRYGRRQHVLLSGEQFVMIEPLLEFLQEGAVVSPELLMTEADIELARDLAEDREPTEGENTQIAALLAEADSE